ncbi:hypothetical protein BH20ACT9_BH20ACT9_18170 [soil metagenome]
MRGDAYEQRNADLRRWREQFGDTTRLADVRAGQRTACVGLVTSMRLVPGRRFEVTIEDGSGALTGMWPTRGDAPVAELGTAVRLRGTATHRDDGVLAMEEPAVEDVDQPYD